jgi:hypothetical protein
VAVPGLGTTVGVGVAGAVESVGLGVDVGEKTEDGVTVAVGDPVAVGVGVPLGVGLAVIVGVGVVVAEGVTVGVAEAVGVGVWAEATGDALTTNTVSKHRSP